MELYNDTSYLAAKLYTERYSTSFSASCQLFAPELRSHIYAIYGLVRVADEIVDTYMGDDQLTQLDMLEAEIKFARARGFSANPLVHAFALSAESFEIEDKLIAPFFESMRMDIGQSYTAERYAEYIYGSAEVIGLMCLKVFVASDKQRFEQLEPGARALGSAYQKVNFLRDIRADHELGRMYFPDVTYEAFDDSAKQVVEQSIASEFTTARNYINQLPLSARAAVLLSFEYYDALLEEITAHSANELKSRRIRVADTKKLRLLMTARLRKLGAKQ